MKKIFYSIFLILAVVVCSCNKLDNYDLPNATITGKVVDDVTNETIQNGGINAGISIQLFEGNSKQPITTMALPDGRFTNAALFDGDYKFMPLGPFRLVGDTIRLKISGVTTTEARVLPNLRLKVTSVAISGTTGTVKLQYTKVHATEVINQLGVVWSTIDNPNITTFFGGASKMENVTSQNLTTGEKTITITGLVAGTKYYIRGAGTTNNPGTLYNYSVPITTP